MGDFNEREMNLLKKQIYELTAEKQHLERENSKVLYLESKIIGLVKQKEELPAEFLKNSCHYQVVGWIEAMKKPRKGFPPPDDILAYTKRVWGKSDCKDPRVRICFEEVCYRFHQEHGNVSGDGLFVNENGDIFETEMDMLHNRNMLLPEQRKKWWGPAFKEY